MKGWKRTVLSAALTLILAVLLSGQVWAGNYKLGHVAPPSHPYHLGALKFAELVKERTGGQIAIDVFPSSQIGNERDLVEGLQLGTVDFVVTSTGPMSSFEPKFGAPDLPFIFRDLPHAYKVLDGEVGRELYASLEKKGITGLSWFENGFRQVTNSKRPIEKAEDFKGLKLRTMENPIHVAFFRELGADPTPMAFGEVFSALEQKVVDGQENPVAAVLTTKFYEVQKYLAMTGHVYTAVPLLVRSNLLNSFKPEQRKIVLDAAKEAGVYQRQLLADQEKKGLDELKAKGMQITYPDRSKLREATTPVYKKFEATIGQDLIRKILDTK
ncbi:MAG: TRAP transporter substrate-binding protein [Thermodesulfobacteriota bacterium]